MDFSEVLRRRRVVRSYRDDPVDARTVDRIVAAGLKGPSAGFTQGVRFVVVTERETRGAIADLAGEQDYVDRGFTPWVSRAPVHVVVCVREDDYHDRYREPDKLRDDGTEMEWPIPFWWVDAGAALMLVLLATVNEGLAAGFLGFHRLDGLRDLLAIPDDVAVIGVVTLGHPAPDRPSGSLARGRKPVHEMVHRDRWR